MDLQQLKKKLLWLKDYYLLTALVVIVVIGVFISLFTSIFQINKKDQSCLNVLILDDRMSSNKDQALTDLFSTILEGSVDVSAYTKSDPQQFQAFVVRTTSNGNDIVIAPLEEMQQLYENHYVLDYSKTTESALWYEDISQGRGSRPGPGLASEADNTETAMDTEMIAEDTTADADGEDMYIAIAAAGDHPDNARQVLDELAKQEAK